MEISEKSSFNKRFINRFLNVVELIGNKLPHPVVLFLILSIVIIIVSEIALRSNLNVTYIGFNRVTSNIEEMNVRVRSLLSSSGVLFLFSNFTNNYINYAPLGLMLVTIAGVGLTEKTGLLVVILKKILIKTNPRYITFVLIFLGVMSNVAADAIGYLILIPLGAKIFKALNRHPLAGFAATFYGVSAGFAANLLIGPGDAIVSGISTEAAKIFIPNYTVLPTSNWYFMIISTFLLSVIGVFITEKMIEPRLGRYDRLNSEESEEENDMNLESSLSSEEEKGLKFSVITIIVYILVMLMMLIPENGVLRDNGNINTFLSRGLMPAIMLFFMLPGTVYGIVTKQITDSSSFSKMIIQSLSEVGGFLAFALFASQFIVYFNYTNLGIIAAVKGAELLKEFNLVGLPLIVLFLLLTCILNLFMGSASAKWSIMAPVFVPMFYNLGLTPEFTQLIFRVGDSSTNIISPLMTYFAIILVFLQKYDKKAGIGSIISLMLPYTVVTILSWGLLLIGWYYLNIPIGPNSLVRL